MSVSEAAQDKTENLSSDLVSQLRQFVSTEDLSFLIRRATAGDSYPSLLQHFGHAPELMARTLHRRRKRNPVLVGELGTDGFNLLLDFVRSALTEPSLRLREKQFLLVDLLYSPAGTVPAALNRVFSLLASRRDVVLCLKSCGEYLLGSHAEAVRAQLFQFASGRTGQLILLLSPPEYDALIASYNDTVNPFSRIVIAEPDAGTAEVLVTEYVERLQREFQCDVSSDAIRAAVELSSHFMPNERLPGKATRVLVTACENAAFDAAQGRSATVSRDDVAHAVSEITALPIETIRGNDDCIDYGELLRGSIVGQDRAVEEIATELRLIKAGMVDPSKPASVILLVGQTGTGKTEMAKALADIYSPSHQLRPYPLGNYVESHSVSGLIGVPAGYVGHERGGPLVNDLLADPYRVFLLDEFDKAHPDVLQPLLNLFDEGWIRDHRGVQASARHAIFVLTTNLGQRVITDMVRQGKTMDEIAVRIREVLPQMRQGKSSRPTFTPEMLSRISRIIVFKPLDVDALTGIARWQVEQRSRIWRKQRGKALLVEDNLIQAIAAEADRINSATKGSAGGRTVHRIVTQWIDASLIQMMQNRRMELQQCSVVKLAYRLNAIENGLLPVNIELT